MRILDPLFVTIFLVLSSCETGKSKTPSNSGQSVETVSLPTSDSSMKIKVAVFQNVRALQDRLSENGIGILRRWRRDEIGWIASSDYYSFGTPSDVNGIENNLAYYLESDNETYVKTLKIILNIYNDSEKKQAITKFKEIVRRTFKSLSLDVPEGLFGRLEYEKDFHATNNNYNTSLVLDKSKINTWILKIESK